MPVGKLRLFAVIVSAYLIAAVVSAVGMLGFIGLAAATIVRQLGVRTLAWQLISAFLVGALLLAITDLLLQLLNFLYATQFPDRCSHRLIGHAVIAVADVPRVAAQRTANRRGTEKQRRFRPHFTWLLIILFAVSLWLALNVGKSAFDQWSVLDFNHPFAPEISICAIRAF